ncbi:DsrE family protein [Sulfurimonas sp. MAG313]|nr:DsrE family protein [Sulfurimonas sp. MAG313]MDF1880967.1 DsrE family protein [Sulfurimonas sp. MAG313]
MKLWIILVMCFSVYAGEHKVLLDVKTGNPKLLEKNLIDRIIDIQSFYALQGEKVKISVIVSGNAYKFFILDLDKTLYNLNKNFEELRERLQIKLRLLSTEYDVVFETCETGMKRRDLSEEDLVDFARPIHSYSIGLIKWQNMGYAYLPVH